MTTAHDIAAAVEKLVREHDRYDRAATELEELLIAAGAFTEDDDYQEAVSRAVDAVGDVVEVLTGSRYRELDRAVGIVMRRLELAP